MIYVFGWFLCGILTIVIAAIEERMTSQKEKDNESALLTALILGPISLIICLCHFIRKLKLLTRFYNYITRC